MSEEILCVVRGGERGTAPMSAGSMAVCAGRGLNEALGIGDNSSPRGSYKVEEGRVGKIFIMSFNNKGVQTRTP